MKVERKTTPPVFEPITITLETEDEAVTLYHVLNYGSSSATDFRYKYPVHKNMHKEMWNKFADVYGPSSKS